MAPAFVQKANTFTSAGSTTIIGTFTNNITAGNLICGFITGSGAPTCTVKDGNSTVATMVPNSTGVEDSGNGTSAWMFYIPPSSETGGTKTVTATFSGSTSFRGIVVQEVSGIQSTSPLDKSTLTAFTSSTTPTGTSETTTAAGEYCYAAVCPDNGSPSSITAGTNYSWFLENDNTQNIADEQLVQASAGAIAAGFHFSSAIPGLIGLMTFFAASAAGPISYQPRRIVPVRLTRFT